MNELQLGLIAAGLLAVVAVLGYNHWVEREQRRQARTMRDGIATPAAADSERVEPVLAIADTPDENGGYPVDISTLVPPPYDGRTMTGGRLKSSQHPIAAADLREAALGLSAAAGRAFTWWVPDHGDEWRPLDEADQDSFDQVAGAVVIADRRGPITPEQIAALHGAMRDLVSAWDAMLILDDVDNLSSAAADLDAFCASVDAQIALHVVAQGRPIAGSKLRGILEAGGLRLALDGRYRGDPDEPEAFSAARPNDGRFVAAEMASAEFEGVDLWLDVPRVAAGGEVFDRMVLLARQLAQGLEGQLVDDRGQPISDEALAEIRAAIGEMQQRMAAQDIPAGGERAKRLFA